MFAESDERGGWTIIQNRLDRLARTSTEQQHLGKLLGTAPQIVLIHHAVILTEANEFGFSRCLPLLVALR
jgi:hypothetical protein